TVPGIDRPRLFSWMGRHAPDAGEPLSVSLISGGKSNLTYLVETRERRVVLRRPPLGHVLPTAHDMGREWRVISALAPTPVPVPGPVAFCSDEDVIGAPFYLMEYVAGAAVRSRSDLGDLGPEPTRRLSERLAEVLAAIHAVDHREAGLDGFGRPDGYLTRQIERWCKQWERSKTADRPDFDRLAARPRERLPAHAAGTLVPGAYRPDHNPVRLRPGPDSRPDGYLTRQIERWCKQWERSKAADRPDFDRLAARLRERLPAHSAGTLVHGDYRLDNTLVRLGPDPEIRAVVDWEMSTLGDPLADLGLTLTYWQDAGDEERAGTPVAGDVTAAPGFLTAAGFAARYAEVSGRDTGELGF